MPNMVTAVLASYRGYDTFGETLVIFTAGIAVLLLLGIQEGPHARPGRAAIGGDQIVLRVVVKLLIPLILLFALYVQFHGEIGPGGGFQAGVIFSAAFVLYALVFGMGLARAVATERVLRVLAAFGMLLYIGVGLASLFAGANFLDFNVLAQDRVEGQHLGAAGEQRLDDHHGRGLARAAADMKRAGLVFEPRKWYPTLYRAVVHLADDLGCYLGELVTLGHGAIVHACTIRDEVLVGMGAVVAGTTHAPTRPGGRPGEATSSSRDQIISASAKTRATRPIVPHSPSMRSRIIGGTPARTRTHGG